MIKNWILKKNTYSGLGIKCDNGFELWPWYIFSDARNRSLFEFKHKMLLELASAHISLRTCSKHVNDTDVLALDPFK